MQNQVAYTHPEMYDENGNLIPDEIVAVRFEHNDDSEEDDEDQSRVNQEKTTSTRKTATKPRTVTVKKKELPPNPMVHELLEAVDSERVNAKKVELLRAHGDDSFKMVMIWNFDETVVSMLPEGKVPYQPVEGDVQANREQGIPQRTTIRNAARQFYRL